MSQRGELSLQPMPQGDENQLQKQLGEVKGVVRSCCCGPEASLVNLQFVHYMSEQTYTSQHNQSPKGAVMMTLDCIQNYQH